MIVKEINRTQYGRKTILYSVIFALLIVSFSFLFVSSNTANAIQLQYAPVVAIEDITETSIKIKVSIDSNETQASQISRYNVYIKTMAGSSLGGYSGSINTTKTSVTLTRDTALYPGKMYSYSATFRNQAGETITSEATGTFQMAGVHDPRVTGVTFADLDERRVMVIEGRGFLDSYNDGLEKQAITLNGQGLPFCAGAGAGLPGYTAQNLVDLLGIDSTVVSDTPICYLYYDNSGNAVFSDTVATVWLPEGFDENAPGSVALLEVPAFSFNEQESFPASISQGNEALADGLIIDNRPMFKGVAPAGSTVVVTVRSDPVICTTVADEEGNWTCTLPSSLPPGAHTVYVSVTNTLNQTIELGPFSVSVLGLSGVLPPNTGIKPRNTSPWLLSSLATPRIY